MRDRFVVIFEPLSQDPRVKELLQGLREQGVRVSSGNVLTLESELELQMFRRETKRLGLNSDHAIIRRERVYAPEDRAAAELLLLTVRRAPKGMGGPTYGTRFDMSPACPRCGTGARQVSPLVLRPSDMNPSRHLMETLDREILVSPAVREVIVSTPLTGVEMRQCVSVRGEHPLPWFQLITEFELPPADPASEIDRDRQCPACGRDGFFAGLGRPFELVYAAASISMASIPDFSHTFERFGNSVIRAPFAESHFAQPHAVVTQAAYQALSSLRIREVEFVPIVLQV